MTKAIGLDRGRLTKILGMLGSSYDGEVAAAGRMADELVRAAGLTWSEILSERQESGAGSQEWRPPTMTAEAIALCLRWPKWLSPWELNFLSSLSTQRRVSAKQFEVLAEILAKVEIARGHT